MKLMVSKDCGISYQCEATGSLEELQKQGAVLDEEGWRWTIEEDNGEIKDASKIHKGIMATMARFRKTEKS